MSSNYLTNCNTVPICESINFPWSCISIVVVQKAPSPNDLHWAISFVEVKIACEFPILPNIISLLREEAGVTELYKKDYMGMRERGWEEFHPSCIAKTIRTFMIVLWVVNADNTVLFCSEIN